MEGGERELAEKIFSAYIFSDGIGNRARGQALSGPGPGFCTEVARALGGKWYFRAGRSLWQEVSREHEVRAGFLPNPPGH